MTSDSLDKHTSSTECSTALVAIREEDLGTVALFLHHHMNSRITQQGWQQGISRSWLSDVPNYGFMLRCGDQIVGVLCAIYSEQYVEGSLKRFCNPHSWCVLPDFRKRSIDLVLALIRQKDYTFTMFSPNKEGLEIFKYLKFEPLDNRVYICLNIPAVHGKGKVVDFQDIQQVTAHLSEQDARHYLDHANFPWLNFLFFNVRDQYGFMVFKRNRYKRLGSAWIMHISDAALFRQCWPSIRTHLLFKYGLFTSKIEARLLDLPIKTWLDSEQGHQKFYLSNELSADSVQNLYSELVTLDL